VVASRPTRIQNVAEQDGCNREFDSGACCSRASPGLLDRQIGGGSPAVRPPRRIGRFRWRSARCLRRHARSSTVATVRNG